MALDIKKIIQYPLLRGQFFEKEFPKGQIVIHHTAGSSSPKITIDGWNSNNDIIGTAFVIGGIPKQYDKFKDGDIFQCFKDGDIFQCYPSKLWAYHLGISAETFAKYSIPYQRLDKTSIGIEICNWGYLEKQPNGTFKNYVGGIVPMDEVADLEENYRGHRYYHAYTTAQLSSLKDLLIYLCEKYNIPKTYNAKMWDISQSALNGQSGIWTHTSFRSDKTDCSKQPALISMLSSIQ